jgi:hypothetical protein
VDWFKVQADIGSSAKVDELSDRAYRGMTYLWGYAMRHETDGRVPPNACRIVPRVTAGVMRELEEHGFLHRNGAGWVIHDWEEHQEEALRLQERKRRDAERKKDERRRSREEVK